MKLRISLTPIISKNTEEDVKMNSIYLNIFYIFIVIAVVLLALSILLFIRFNIPKVVGDISGANIKKALKKSREINEKSGKKEYKASKVNQQRGKITDDINNTKNKKNIAYGSISTEDLKIPSQSNTEDSNATTVLNNELTTVLGDNSTTVLSNNQTNQTTVLDNNENAIQNQIYSDDLPDVEVSGFVVEEDISFTESNEVIV